MPHSANSAGRNFGQPREDIEVEPNADQAICVTRARQTERSPRMEPFSSIKRLKRPIHAGFQPLFHSTYPTKNYSSKVSGGPRSRSSPSETAAFLCALVCKTKMAPKYSTGMGPKNAEARRTVERCEDQERQAAREDVQIFRSPKRSMKAKENEPAVRQLRSR